MLRLNDIKETDFPRKGAGLLPIGIPISCLNTIFPIYINEEEFRRKLLHVYSESLFSD